MQQQVNLLNAFTPPTQDLFSGKLILKVCGGFILLLALYYGYLYKQSIDLSNKAEKIKQQQSLAAKSLLNLADRYPKIASKEELEGEVEKLARKIDSTSHLIATFGKKTEGFSGYLKSLAQDVIPGLWLRNIYIEPKQDDFILIGSALKSELIPAFLQQLSQDKPYANVQFKQLRVYRRRSDTSQVSFALRTVPVEEEADESTVDPDFKEKETADKKSDVGSPQDILDSFGNKAAGGSGPLGNFDLEQLGNIIKQFQGKEN